MLAKDCRDSFNAKFWNDKEECLIDYIGLKPEPLKEYQIRCNQIWAVSLPFSILDREREKKVVRAVYKKLYTPYGLRPVSSRGCFAQAWSVGEILKVYDALEGNYGF